MELELTVKILGHAVGLHFCLDGGKLVTDHGSEVEVHELESDTQLFGFQPNRPDDDDLEDEDEEDHTGGSGGARAGGLRRGTRRGR